MSSTEGDERGPSIGPLATIYSEAEADILPRLGQEANTLDECIEMVKESIEEIYAEKLEEMKRGFLYQIEELTEESELLKEEIHQLKREKQEREAAQQPAEDIRQIIEQGIREEYQRKFEALESELFDKFQTDTEDIMVRVQDEIEELLVSKGLTRERRMEIEAQVREELRQQLAAPREQCFDENDVEDAYTASVHGCSVQGHGPACETARDQLASSSCSERTAAAAAVRTQRKKTPG